VGSRQPGSFLTRVAERELMRLRQLKALDELVPWKDKDHPELKQGAAKWVRKLRRGTEQRRKHDEYTPAQRRVIDARLAKADVDIKAGRCRALLKRPRNL